MSNTTEQEFKPLTPLDSLIEFNECEEGDIRSLIRTFNVDGVNMSMVLGAMKHYAKYHAELAFNAGYKRFEFEDYGGRTTKEEPTKEQYINKTFTNT